MTILFALLLAGCTGSSEWTPEQEAVFDAVQTWNTAYAGQDTDALWKMLSPDSKEWYRRELEGEGGLRQTVKMDRAALHEGTPAEERERIEKFLATLPTDPEKMTPKDYYKWKLTPKLTQEAAEANARLFARTNIQEISVQGDKAVMVLKEGKPDRYSWVRHDGDWKFDLPPSTMRALEEARQRERQKN
jgi:hypothetical protein